MFVQTPDKATSLKRLKRWLEIMTEVAKTPERLEMHRWRGTPGDRSAEACGTVACAAGHASMDQGFQAEGLMVDRFWAPAIRSSRGYEIGIPAMARFFGISEAQAGFICLPRHYWSDSKRVPAIDPKSVMRHIQLTIDAVERRPF